MTFHLGLDVVLWCRICWGKKQKKKRGTTEPWKFRDVGVTTQAKHSKIKPKEWWNSSVVNGKYNFQTLHQKNTKSSVMEVWNKPLLKLKKNGKKLPSGSEKIALLQELQQLQARLKQRPGHDHVRRAGRNGEKALIFYTSWESSTLLSTWFFWVHTWWAHCVNVYYILVHNRNAVLQKLYTLPWYLFSTLNLGPFTVWSVRAWETWDNLPRCWWLLCSCKWVVHHTTFIQLYNFGMQSNTHWKLKTKKTTENTQKPNSETLFPPIVFCCNWLKFYPLATWHNLGAIWCIFNAWEPPACQLWLFMTVVNVTASGINTRKLHGKFPWKMCVFLSVCRFQMNPKISTCLHLV